MVYCSIDGGDIRNRNLLYIFINVVILTLNTRTSWTNWFYATGILLKFSGFAMYYCISVFICKEFQYGGNCRELFIQSLADTATVRNQRINFNLSGKHI